MNNPTKVGLLAGMMVLAVLTVSGSATAHTTQTVSSDGGGGDGGGCSSGLFPLWTGVPCLVRNWGGFGTGTAEGIACNYVGDPACV